MPPRATLAIDVVGDRPPGLRHTRFAAQQRQGRDRRPDARAQRATRPSVDLSPGPAPQPAPRRARAPRSAIDLSGEPLHRRGYRQAGVAAPLKENLAAALLLRAGWPAHGRAGGALRDPMCGSGTLVIEAARIAADVAPGLLRPPLRLRALAAHEPTCGGMRAAAPRQRRRAALGRGRFRGYDRDPSAIRAALANAARRSVAGHLAFARASSHARRDPARTAWSWSTRLTVRGSREGGTLEPLTPTGPHAPRVLPGDGKRRCSPAIRRSAARSASGLSLAHVLQRADRVPAAPLRAAAGHGRAGSGDRAVAAARGGAQPGPAPRCSGTALRKNFPDLETWANRNGRRLLPRLRRRPARVRVRHRPLWNDQRWACVQEYAAPRTVARRRPADVATRRWPCCPRCSALPAERNVLRCARRQRGSEQYEKLGERGEFHEVHEGGHRSW